MGLVAAGCDLFDLYTAPLTAPVWHLELQQSRCINKRKTTPPRQLCIAHRRLSMCWNHNIKRALLHRFHKTCTLLR